MRAKSLFVLILATAVATIASFMIGHASAKQANWKDGTAYLLGDPSEPGFSVRVDDWTYGAGGAVPHWIDRKGVTHEGGAGLRSAGVGHFAMLRICVRQRPLMPLVARLIPARRA